MNLQWIVYACLGFIPGLFIGALVQYYGSLNEEDRDEY